MTLHFSCEVANCCVHLSFLPLSPIYSCIILLDSLLFYYHHPVGSYVNDPIDTADSEEFTMSYINSRRHENR